MAPQLSRRILSALTAPRRRPAGAARLRCEQLEGREVPAVFTVQSPMSFTGLNNNGCVATADLNKDGLTDAVLTNFGTGYGSPYDSGTPASSITILYGRSAANGGGFTRVEKNTGGQNVAFVAVGDINNDTWPDVVAVNANRQNAGSVSVFLNDGAGGLSLAAVPFSSFNNNASWIGLADMTGDNVLDIVTCGFGKDAGAEAEPIGHNISIFQGNGDGTFSSGPVTTLNPGISFIPTALAIADFDNDGKKDIAAAVPGVPPTESDPQSEGSIYVFRGTGSGGFAVPNQYGTGGGALPVNIQAADVNGDNKPDLVVACAGDPNATPEFANSSVGVLLNSSIPSNIDFGIPNSLTANTYGAFAVAIADFDGDNKKDIAAVNHGFYQNFTGPQAFVSVYLGTGTGSQYTFNPASPGTYPTGSNLGGGQYLAIGNFDANTTPDLIVVGSYNRVTLMLNASTPAVPAPQAPTVKVNGATTPSATVTASRVTSLTVTFNTPVSAVDPGAFKLISGGTTLLSGSGGAIGVAGLGTTTLTLTFTGTTGVNFGSLADGNWALTTDLTKVKNSSGTAGTGTATTNNIRRLYGDADGNGTVDGTDLALFGNTFGVSTGEAGFVASLDFDGNGTIDGTDLAELGNRFGITL